MWDVPDDRLRDPALAGTRFALASYVLKLQNLVLRIPLSCAATSEGFNGKGRRKRHPISQREIQTMFFVDCLHVISETSYLKSLSTMENRNKEVPQMDY